MRRADRLFRIVNLLRQGRVVTATRLAEKLQVCERTIYRDVRDLQLSGAPIEGEPGVGYTLRKDFDLPPLMFTAKELTALVLGARLVQAWWRGECCGGKGRAGSNRIGTAGGDAGPAGRHPDVCSGVSDEGG